MRRVLNSRRRFLVDCADRLLLGIASLVTDGEYQILAVAWDSVGDHEKARDCWAKCVERSPNDAMRIFNLRGYARYLYRIGQAATGRETYGKAVSIETADTDTARQTKADTYLMWAKTEEQYGYLDEARRLLAFGRNEIERVGFEPSRKQLRARVEHDFVALIKTSPPQGPEQAGPAAG
jgi:tetratricopeptide (TPR) repeat protein